MDGDAEDTGPPLWPLERSFYMGSAREVARALLGHWLLRRLSIPDAGEDTKWCGGEIVETEAYLADDPACHAYVRETARNRTMWGEAGRAYVFTIYGAYKCFNAVCGPPGVAEAVLIRAVRPTIGAARMKEWRAVTRDHDLLSGPSKLCQALDIGRGLDGTDLCDAGSPVVLARNPERESFVRTLGPLVVCTRIGISRGAELPLRFYGRDDPNISKKATASQIAQLEEWG
jgi:DNA-3-methyladenine glycosylase